MAGSDDRDVRKKQTPPAGVRAQTASPAESFEDETPVEGDPVSQINTRARSAANNSKQAVNRIAVLDVKLEGYQRQVDTYFEIDQTDHRRIYTQLDSNNEKLGAIQSDISEFKTSVQSDLGDLKGVVGEAIGAVRTLTSTIEQKAKVDSAREIAKTEVDAKAAIVKAEVDAKAAIVKAEIEQRERIADVEVDQREKISVIRSSEATAKYRLKRNYRLLVILGAIITAVVTYALATR